ncbi:unnamed protein product [Meganyctiphanes norvegica]|uniref:Uncharacterized protein n=1 Tax=Meganyctiphanes norvegica TaxID=48144 RepID=A0AAV2QF34_MEGNR
MARNLNWCGPPVALVPSEPVQSTGRHSAFAALRHCRRQHKVCHSAAKKRDFVERCCDQVPPRIPELVMPNYRFRQFSCISNLGAQFPKPPYSSAGGRDS